MEEKWKPKRGKRLALRVAVTDPYVTILENAVQKWKDYHSDCYKEQEYMLAYADGKTAEFMPGTTDLFNLAMYKENVGKDYKRLVFYLCTVEDNLISNGWDAPIEPEPLAKVGRMDSGEFTESVGLQPLQGDRFLQDIVSRYADEFEFSSEASCATGSSAGVSTATIVLPADNGIFASSPRAAENGTQNNNQVLWSSEQSSSSAPEQAPVSLVEMERELTYSQRMFNLGSAFHGDDDDAVILAVRRRRIWADTYQKCKRLFVDGIKPIQVRFIGEEAVDTGGPIKELFSLVFDEAKKFLMCTGDGIAFTLLHDIEKTRNGYFRLFGELIAVALLQGCAGPRCMIPSVVSRLLNGPVIQPSAHDIPDLDIQDKLKDLLSAVDEKDFQLKIDAFPERFNFGVTRMKVKYSDREELIKDIAQHCCISICHEEILEMRKGLDVIGLLQILELHYDEAKNEFLLPAMQKADDIMSLFKNIRYLEEKEANSTADKKKRDREEDIVYNLTNFLESLQHDGAMDLPLIVLDEDGVEEQTTIKITLEEVCRFFTGSKFVTTSMVGQGSITFDHDGRIGSVEAHTCNVQLTFPVTKRYYGSEDGFINSFTEDMRSGSGFGMV